MRVLIAPDSFKGTLTASAAARTIADGWSAARPTDVLDICPLSDGGDGVVDVVLATGGWTQCTGVVHDPLGRPVTATWARRSGQALVETAEACGLQHLSPRERDPLRATTTGVGQLLQQAWQEGVEELFVGLGGSATVDGGIGMLSVLGVEALDGRDRPVGHGPESMERVRRLTPGQAGVWAGRRLTVLTDVITTLPDAARVFGPQKGAGPGTVAALSRGLENWADAIETGFGIPGLRDVPGTGAAGGLGLALSALGARLVSGATFISELVGLEARVASSDLVVVGEGQLDSTSLDGKVLGLVLDLAGRRNIPVAAVVGRAAIAVERLVGVAEAAAEGPGDDPAADVRAAAHQLARQVPASFEAAGEPLGKQE